MSDETDPIEAWAALDPERAGVDWLTAPDRAGPVDRTVRPELVAIVRAAGPAAECTHRSTATDWERCGWCPACRLAVRLDALRVKLRATMGADRG